MWECREQSTAAEGALLSDCEGCGAHMLCLGAEDLAELMRSESIAPALDQIEEYASPLPSRANWRS
jgi:hypothetical protein